jgi:photosystem II stability/assembly factor-like uncharacterized protein
MRIRFCFPLILVAFAACDRVTSPSHRDAGDDGGVATWEQIDAGAVNFNAVAGSAPDNVFIVGDQGTILHWDGTALLPEASGTLANLRGVAVVDQTLVYAVGDQGTLLRRDNGVWVSDLPVSAAVLNAVHGTSTYAVAVGEQSTILTYSQGTWGAIADAPSNNYYDVSFASDGCQVVGGQGIVVRVDWAKRSVVSTSPISNSKLAYTKTVAAALPYGSGSLLVGVDGGFFNWANGTATRKATLPQKFLRALSVVDGTAWIVGHEGFVVSGPVDGTLVVVPTPDDRWLVGVYAAAANDVWVVGRSGLIMRGPPGARLLDGGVP